MVFAHNAKEQDWLTESLCDLTAPHLSQTTFLQYRTLYSVASPEVFVTAVAWSHSYYKALSHSSRAASTQPLGFVRA